MEQRCIRTLYPIPLTFAPSPLQIIYNSSFILFFLFNFCTFIFFLIFNIFKFDMSSPLHGIQGITSIQLTFMIQIFCRITVKNVSGLI